MLRETDVAYLAGLFDGEGSVYYKQTKQIRHKRSMENLLIIFWRNQVWKLP